MTVSVSDAGLMSEFNHEDPEIPCKCHGPPVELGIRPYLDIHARIPHGDERLVILLYHNWVTPDTAYVVFGTTHRILGLFPPNPLFQWFGLSPDED